MLLSQEEPWLLSLPLLSSSTTSWTTSHPPTIDIKETVTLEALIHSSTTNSEIGVIVSHPYGPLGGDLHNNIVQHVTKAMIHLGFSTLRYNMRGVGQSTKKTSWTGEPESQDLIRLIKWWTHPTSFLSSSSSLSSDSHTHHLKNKQSGMVHVNLFEQPKCIPSKVIVIGYSYGALISLPSLVDSTIDSKTIPTTTKEEEEQEQDLNLNLNSNSNFMFNNTKKTQTNPCIGLMAISLPTKYIPMLSFFHSSLYSKPLLTTIPKLFLVGNQDQFTSFTHLKSFVECICINKEQQHHQSTSIPSFSISNLQTYSFQNTDLILLPNVDHFMINKESQLIQTLLPWIQTKFLS